MILSTAPYPVADDRPRRGFTLIELILVMALLAIAASLSAPRMAAFFRGRSLDQEARRLLSLSHYGASRAVAEGVPVRLWIDAAGGAYGLEVESGYGRGGESVMEFAVDRDLTLEVLTPDEVLPYEDTGGMNPAVVRRDGILFLPDGLIDPASTPRITVRQGDDGALCLVPASHGLAYELLHESELLPR